MSSAPPSRPPEAPPAAAARPARGIFVRLAILFTVLIFVGTVFLIYYRWLTVAEPTTVVVLTADETLDGAVVTVEGVALPQPLIAALDERGRHRARFFLHPGSYTIRVEHDDELVYQHQFMVVGEARQFLQINLATDPALPQGP
jgi:hypothetical protein